MRFHDNQFVNSLVTDLAELDKLRFGWGKWWTLEAEPGAPADAVKKAAWLFAMFRRALHRFGNDCYGLAFIFNAGSSQAERMLPDLLAALKHVRWRWLTAPASPTRELHAVVFEIDRLLADGQRAYADPKLLAA